MSDTASVRVPELDLELASGTLGGIVTTVEGLIAKIIEREDVKIYIKMRLIAIHEGSTSLWIKFKERRRYGNETIFSCGVAVGGIFRSDIVLPIRYCRGKSYAYNELVPLGHDGNIWNIDLNP
ncbi:Zinc finger, ZPR1-type [Dillenia turbinata]|uniref:Zinc finger, ZPR1-type n=1 Tax=Dillenia turbinata TaxID=194707 RepID=A0AAN8ZB66_9MAGN